MNYEQAKERLLDEEGVEESTMMGTACLRYKMAFLGMMFEKEDSLIVKLPAERVNELIAEGVGREFNFTKKRFKEWVLISRDSEEVYELYLRETLEFARGRSDFFERLVSKLKKKIRKHEYRERMRKRRRHDPGDF